MAWSRVPFRRSRRHRILGGVCGGIGEALGWSPLVVRVLFVVLSLFPLLPGSIVYLVLWVLVPRAPR
ncbi:MAG: PspC domain-containing protein [Acidobacteria bacterium]|nr:PspC domain-containing protein [Acidobacteriota bacterium]